MLNKIEKGLMKFIFKMCDGKTSAIFTPNMLLETINPKYRFSERELGVALRNLSLAGYIDVVSSDNKGSLAYVINLKEKGLSYDREMEENKKRVYMFLLKAALWASACFIVTQILVSIFS